MKISLSSVAATSSLLSLASPATAANPMGCVSDFDATKDYFPEKSQVTDATTYTIEYGLNYKILKITPTLGDASAVSHSYLLVQCGTPVPADLDTSAFTKVVTIPLESFGADTATFIPFFEILGLRHRQIAHAGQSDFFASSCFNELVDSGDVTILTTTSNETAISEQGVSLDTPFFTGPFAASSSAFDPTVVIHEYADRTNLGVFEWIKFMGAFFNKEKEANQAFEYEKSRYDCAKDNAALIQQDLNETKTVVWANPFGATFYTASDCPNNYYCEIATLCGANLLSLPAFPGNALNITQFMDFAEDADVWVYPGTDIQATLNAFPELQNLKAVQNGEVYDINGHGEDAWLNDRKVEPAALLEDFCHIVGTSSLEYPHDPAFLRNIDDPEKTVDACNDQCDPYRHFGDFCVPIEDVGAAAATMDSMMDLPANCAAPTSAPSSAPSMTPTSAAANDIMNTSGVAQSILALVAVLFVANMI